MSRRSDIKPVLQFCNQSAQEWVVNINTGAVVKRLHLQAFFCFVLFFCTCKKACARASTLNHALATRRVHHYSTPHYALPITPVHQFSALNHAHTTRFVYLYSILHHALSAKPINQYLTPNHALESRRVHHYSVRLRALATDLFHEYSAWWGC